MKTQTALQDYIQERDSVVLDCNAEQFNKWALKQGYRFTCIESAEIAMHKMRSSIANFPLEIRLASDQWLRERGYESWLS